MYPGFAVRAALPRWNIAALTTPIRTLRFAAQVTALDFEADEALYRYEVASGEMQVVAARHTRQAAPPTEAATWLAEEQRTLLQHIRQGDDRQARTTAANRLNAPRSPHPLPVPSGETIDQIQRSPDGRYVTFRARKRAPNRPPTRYIDYVDASGYSQVREARAKVGEPRDRYRLGVVAYDPAVAPDSVAVRWIELEDAGDQYTVPHGPFWNLDGTRGVVQFIGEYHQNLWIAEVDLDQATATVLTHDHDDAWIGGPPASCRPPCRNVSSNQ